LGVAAEHFEAMEDGQPGKAAAYFFLERLAERI